MRYNLSVLACLVFCFLAGCGREAPHFAARPSLKGHVSEVTSIAFHPDGKTLATRDSKSIMLWDLTKSSVLRTLAGDGRDDGSVVFTPDGSRLASEGIDEVRLWRMGENDPTKPATLLCPGALDPTKTSKTRGWGLAFSPDGQRLVMGGSHGEDNGCLTLWDLSAGIDSKTPAIELAKLKRPITTVAFSADGQTIGSGSMDGKIVLWDSETHEKKRSIDAGRTFLAPVLFSPDGESVVSANEARWVKFWDRKTGNPGATYKGHIKAVLSIAFHPNGRTMVSGDSGGTIFVWDVPSRQALIRLEPKDHGKVWALAFSPDGKILASTGEDRLVHLWDVSGDLPVVRK
jgi:WD40 repeat protein